MPGRGGIPTPARRPRPIPFSTNGICWGATRCQPARILLIREEKSDRRGIRMPDPAVSAPDQGEILFLATESQVYAFDLSETFRIAMGRHESNDVQLHSRNVSNHHAELLKEADGLYLHDLRSTNGTFLNDEKIRHCRISAGDNIRIGSHLLSVQFKPRKVAWEGASRLYSEDVFAIGGG